MSPQLFKLQHTVGEELLAAGWHASSIAISSKPGSAWVLFDPSRQVRVRMCADVAAVAAEVTAGQQPGGPTRTFPWRLTINDAPVTAIIAALLAAPGAEAGSARSHRQLIRALRATGLRCDRLFLMVGLSGIATWSSVDRTASATWAMPFRREPGGWRILTPATHLEATNGVPADVLTPLIKAARRCEGRQQ